MNRRTRTRGLSLAAAMLAVTGCQDLLVENLNDPDRFGAAADPVLIQELAVAGFDEYFDRMHGLGDGTPLFLSMSSEQGYASTAALINVDAAEPRSTWSNIESISVAGGVGPQNYYSVGGSNLMLVWSIGDDITRAADPSLAEPLVLIQNDVASVPVDLTPRLRAYAHLLKGLALGQLANMYADATAIRMSEPIPVTTAEQVAMIRPSNEVLAIALEELEAAKAIFAANPGIVYPAWNDTLDPMLGVAGPGGTPAGGTDRWFGMQATSAQLIPFINTTAARFIILNARNPAERATLPYFTGGWQAVVDTYLANGVTADFSVPLLTGRRTSNLYTVAQRQGGTAGFSIMNRLIGQADTSGAFQAWSAATIDARAPFELATPDRRITGNGTITTTPASSGPFNGRTVFPARGAYVRFHKLGNCCLGLGYWTGNYQWRRHAQELGIADANLITGQNSTSASPTAGGNGSSLGVARFATVDENNLYLAEAHYHLGNLATAVTLVNISRTRTKAVPLQGAQAGLPAATVDGAPHSGTGPRDCVPKRPTTLILSNGDCGDLLSAIAYERMIEMMGFDIVRGFFESRGFGVLPDDSWEELPLPAPEAVFVSLPLETRGGPGGEASATYAPSGTGWDGTP